MSLYKLCPGINFVQYKFCPCLKSAKYKTVYINFVTYKECSYKECHGTDVLAIRKLMGRVNPTNVWPSLILLISAYTI